MNDYVNPEIRCWVLLRNDLPSMNPGKAAAQVHHAGVQMMSKYDDYSLVNEYVVQGKMNGADFFNTTIVLQANVREITEIIQAIGTYDVPFGQVIDPSYPFSVPVELIPYLSEQITLPKLIPEGTTTVYATRSELTCAWILAPVSHPVVDNLKNLKLAD